MVSDKAAYRSQPQRRYHENPMELDELLDAVQDQRSLRCGGSSMRKTEPGRTDKGGCRSIGSLIPASSAAKLERYT
jgi:hypothetical protein